MQIVAEDAQREVEGGLDVVEAEVQPGNKRFGVVALAA